MSTASDSQSSAQRTGSRLGEADTGRCPQCGSELATQAVHGLCPKCLLGVALQDTLADRALPDDIAASRVLGGVPIHFGRYSLVRCLGQGAMGVVYLARDTELDRLVALKVPKFGQDREAAVFTRFADEVRAAASLQHPNICPIYDVGQLDGITYMTMAYIEGGSLSELITSSRPLPLRSVTLLAGKLARALEEAHRRGVVHRDLKPANIMIDRRGEPIIMDFGLARRRTPAEVRLTQSGVLVGTPAYMSPEQLAGEDVGPATDIYSLGVVLYETLTGQLPFSGSLIDVLAQIARDPPLAPSELRAEIPASLDQACRRALAKSPEQRFASMAEFATALGDCLEQCPASDSEAGALAARVQFQPAEWLRLAAYAAAGVVGVSSALLWFGWACSRGGPQETIVPVTSAPSARSVPPDRADDRLPEPQVSKRAGEEPSPLIAGRYLCFVEEDWGKGLPLLAAGEDPALRRLAARELELQQQSDATSSSYGAEAAEVGKQWQQQAETETSQVAVSALLRHAASWYRAALVSIPDDQRPELEGRLAELSKANEVSSPTRETSSVPNSGPAADGVAGAAESTQKGPAALATSGSGSPVPSRAVGPSMAAATDASKVAGETPASDSVALEMEAEEPRESPLEWSTARLKSHSEQRTALLLELKGKTDRRHVGVREDYLEATSEYARLVRLGDEATANLREIDAMLATLQRGGETAKSPTERLSIESEWRRVQAVRERATRRLTMLATEARGRTADIARLETEVTVIRGDVDRLTADMQRLIEQALWDSQPTGWLAAADYDSIAESLSTWTRDEVDLASSLALRSFAQANAGRLTESLQDTRRGTSLNRTSPYCLAARGYAECRKGDSRTGISNLTRAINLAPHSGVLYLLRGLAYQLSGNHNSAREDLSKAVEMASKQPLGHCCLALHLAAAPDERLRDAKAALEHAEAARRLMGYQSWLCWESLAAAYAEAGRFAEAVTAQKRALALAPAEHQPIRQERLTLYQSGVPLRLE